MRVAVNCQVVGGRRDLDHAAARFVGGCAARGGCAERRQHELIFTNDVNVWKSASPITHVKKNTSLPPFALLFDPEREVSSQQARSFAKELQQAKAQVIMIPGSEVDPDKTDELLGTKGHVPTGALMAFLRSQI